MTYGNVITNRGEVIDCERLGHLKVIGDYARAHDYGYILTVNGYVHVVAENRNRDMCIMLNPETVTPIALSRVISLISKSKETTFYLETIFRQRLYEERKYTKQAIVQCLTKLRRKIVEDISRGEWFMTSYYRGQEKVTKPVPTSWAAVDYSKHHPLVRARLWVEAADANHDEANGKPRHFIHDVWQEVDGVRQEYNYPI